MAKEPNMRHITKPTINGAMVDTELRSSQGSSSNIAMDLLLCEYVKLRKVRTGTEYVKRTMNDKKLQVWVLAARVYNYTYMHVIST